MNNKGDQSSADTANPKQSSPSRRQTQNKVPPAVGKPKTKFPSRRQTQNKVPQPSADNKDKLYIVI